MNHRARASLCMIVKNEESQLRLCLEPVRELFDDVVLVDTGSTDATREIAHELGVRVFSFPWRDHFAAARNESLRYARGQWIFWLDADDRIDRHNAAKLKRHLDELHDPLQASILPCLGPTSSMEDTPALRQCRLFPNRPGIRWEGAVHEQILPSARRAGCRFIDAPIEIQHQQDPACTQGRAQRDLRLLSRALRQNPDNPRTLFHLGRVHQALDQPAEAMRHYRESLRHAPPNDDWVPALYANLSHVLSHLRRNVEALAVARQGAARFPDDPAMQCCLGRLLGAVN